MEKRKRIAFVLPSLAVGGAERVLLNIANNLNPKLFEIFLIVIRDESNTYEKHIGRGVRIIRLRSRLRFRYSFLSVLPKLFMIKPDIVFVGMGILNVAFSFVVPFFFNF